MAKGSLRVNGIIVDTDGEIKASTGDSIVIREDDGSAVITVDTNGKTSIGGPMDVGVNDTGYDVKFFGATAGAYAEWDESADELEIRGGAATPGKLLLSTAETTVVDGNKLGQIDFQAPLDSAGTDAILVGASIYAEADATFSASVNATELVFATGASEAAAEKMRIASDGKVGIGTTGPSSLLHVYGTQSNNLVKIQASSNATNDLMGISFQGTGTYPEKARIVAKTLNTGNNNAELQFHTGGHPTTTDVTQAMVITESGKVGIGTTAPSELLEIEKDQNAHTVVSVDNNTAATGASAGFVANSDAAQLYLRSFSSSFTTSSRNIQDSAQLLSVDASGGFVIASNHATADMSFWTNDTQRVTIDGATGQVGIGTTAPYSTLHVHGKAMGTFAMGECIYAKVITHQSNLALNSSLGINHSELAQSGTVFHFRIYSAGAVLSDSINLTEILMVYRSDAYGTLKKILHQSGAQHSGSAGAHIHYDITNASAGNSGSAIMLTGSLQAGGSSSYDQHTYVTIHRMDCRSAGAMFQQS